MKQNQIQFYKSMVSSKRGEGAYLRKNLLDTNEQGLIPSVDFQHKEVVGGGNADGGYFLINDYIFTDFANHTEVYKHTGASQLVSYGVLPDSSEVVAVCETNDNNKVLVLLNNGKLYSVKDSVFTLHHTFSGTIYSGFMVYDGFFWFISINTKIWRLDPNLTTVTVAKNTTAGSQNDVINMQLFNDYIVMVRNLGRFVQFDFWDIGTGSLDTFQKRIVEKNCRHLAFGTVDGTLMFVKSVGNNSNRKEKKGDIVVTAFDGEKFVEMNSIRAGDEEVIIQARQSQSIGNGVMIFSVANNGFELTDTLFKNWVYKVKNDGSIETLFEPSDVDGGNEVIAINIERSYVSMLLQKNDGKAWYHHTKDFLTGYYNYEEYTSSEYVTNFMNNNKNVHKLLSFGVSFEKVFEQLSSAKGERLYIDYRASERDSWTLLHEVNSEKIKNYTADKYSDTLKEIEYNNASMGLTVQSYVITKMPDNSELPRFNEIQFRFRSKKGFTLLSAWYEYDYITRNTK